MRVRFLTSTPLDVQRGSGTYVGIAVLARALEQLGHTVVTESSRRHMPVFTAERLLFNRGLRHEPDFDLTVGFDMDGYRIADRPGHVASLKGVIADEVRFERGFTRLTMSVQARCETEHVRRAPRVVVTSRYSAACVESLYGVPSAVVVPEPIELSDWRQLVSAQPYEPSTGFTVLSVGRFYPRKRIDVLLRAAHILRDRIPGLSVRIVGNGPSAAQWRALARELKLDSVVVWLGDVSRRQLAAEYRNASLFCLPSVQEGFGIVLLEAMAVGKPIVASRAAAIPEVAPHAELVDHGNPEALASGIERLWRNPDLASAQAAAATSWVEQFDSRRVAKLFLAACGHDSLAAASHL